MHTGWGMHAARGRLAFKMLKFGSEWSVQRFLGKIIFVIQTNHNEVSERHDLNISSPEKVDEGCSGENHSRVAVGLVSVWCFFSTVCFQIVTLVAFHTVHFQMCPQLVSPSEQVKILAEMGGLGLGPVRPSIRPSGGPARQLPAVGGGQARRDDAAPAGKHVERNHQVAWQPLVCSETQ